MDLPDSRRADTEITPAMIDAGVSTEGQVEIETLLCHLFQNELGDLGSPHVSRSLCALAKSVADLLLADRPAFQVERQRKKLECLLQEYEIA